MMNDDKNWWINLNFLIKTFLGATNVVASWTPEHWLTGTPTARAKIGPAVAKLIMYIGFKPWTYHLEYNNVLVLPPMMFLEYLEWPNYFERQVSRDLGKQIWWI